MKIKATIEVEFEADEKHGQNQKSNLEIALRRGVGQLTSSIEHGIAQTSVPTGIKRGTAKAKVTKQEIV